MLQEQSNGGAVRDWLLAHGYVDLGLQVVVMALFLLITLIAAAGTLYWLWWFIRLIWPWNVARFITKEIPGIRRGRVAGQEFELGDVARAESEALRLATDTIQELSIRLAGTETALKKLEEAFGNFEDVSGRA